MYYKIITAKTSDLVGGIINRDDKNQGAYTIYDSKGNEVGGLGSSYLVSRDAGKTWELSNFEGAPMECLLVRQPNVLILYAA